MAPRTAAADNFVDRWARHRDWAERWAPDGYRFGLGFGADTNGLGAQPGPRSDPAVPVDYSQPWEAAIGGVVIGQQTSGVRTYDITHDGVAHLHALLGANLEGFLTAAGQPIDREGAAYTYCVEDPMGGLALVDVEFDAHGRVVAVTPRPLDEPELGGSDVGGSDVGGSDVGGLLGP